MNRAKDFATRYAPDPYTKLLMHFNGANNGTTFVEETGRAVTRYGSPVTSTAQSKFGGASGSFPLVADYLQVPNSTDFQFGSGDFTIEAWAFTTSFTGNPGIACLRTSYATNHAWTFYWSSSALNFMFSQAGNNYPGYQFFYTFNIGTWYHLAVVRSGNTLMGFVNGTKQATTFDFTGRTCYPSTAPLTVGVTLGYPSNFNGYIDELRISKGIARYTSNFTPTGPYAR